MSDQFPNKPKGIKIQHFNDYIIITKKRFSCTAIILAINTLVWGYYSSFLAFNILNNEYSIMKIFIGYHEDINANPVQYSDNDFFYNVKGIYRVKLNIFDKLTLKIIPKKYHKKIGILGLIIEIGDTGIRSPESQWLKWEDIDYIKAGEYELQLYSRTGDIVNINYRIKNFNLIASKVLKLANPLDLSEWSKQIKFKRKKNLWYYLHKIFISILFLVYFLGLMRLNFLFFIVISRGLGEELLFGLVSIFFIFCVLSLLNFLFFASIINVKDIVSIFIQKQSIIVFEKSSVFSGFLFIDDFFCNCYKPSQSKYDISDIINIGIAFECDQYNNKDFTIVLIKSNGYVINLDSDPSEPDGLDPIPIYYRLKSILFDQKK